MVSGGRCDREGQWLMWQHLLLQKGSSEGAALAAEKKVHCTMGSQKVIKHIITGVQKKQRLKVLMQLPSLSTCRQSRENCLGLVCE